MYYVKVKKQRIIQFAIIFLYNAFFCLSFEIFGRNVLKFDCCLTLMKAYCFKKKQIYKWKDLLKAKVLQINRTKECQMSNIVIKKNYKWDH